MVAGVLHQFAEYQRFREYSLVTLAAYARTLERFQSWLGRPILTASHTDIIAWIESLDVGASTRTDYINRLSAFYQWAVREELVAKNPVHRVMKPKVARRKPRPISEKDLEKALANAHDPRLYLWLTLGAKVGMRCVEIAGLRAEWLLLDEEYPSIRIIGKGNKEREVPLHPDVLDALYGYGIPRSGRLFSMDDGGPMTARRVSRIGADHFTSLGIAATMHMLRHRFATVLYQHTRDLRLVQEMLGHSDPSTTAGYADVGEAATRQVLSAV